jgi:flagellar biosynthesis/type III secretory pathway protein FliH
MPHFFQTNGKQEMEQILKNVIESLIIESPIKITVSELVYDFILEHLQCSKYSKIIDIQKDQELTNEACKIEWDGGGAKWNLDESYKKIETKLLEIILREAL